MRAKGSAMYYLPSSPNRAWESLNNKLKEPHDEVSKLVGLTSRKLDVTLTLR